MLLQYSILPAPQTAKDNPLCSIVSIRERRRLVSLEKKGPILKVQHCHAHPRSSANDCGNYPPEHGIKTNEAKKTPLTSIHTTNARWTIVVKPSCSIVFDEGSSSSPRILGIHYSRGAQISVTYKEDYCCSNLGFFSVGLTREIDFGRDLL